MTISIVVVCYNSEGGSNTRHITLKVSRLMTSSDIIQEVWKEIRTDFKGQAEDYALYWPVYKLWLTPQQQLGRQLENNTTLELRTRKNFLTLRFLDGSSKKMLTDISRPIKELVQDLCNQLRVEYSDELSLVVAGDYGIPKHHPSRKAESDQMPPVMDGKLKGKVPLKDIAPSKDDPPTLVLTPGMRRREIKIDAAPPSPHVKKDVRLDAAPQGSPSVRKKEFKIGDTVPSPGLKRKGVEPVPLSPALRKKELVQIPAIALPPPPPPPPPPVISKKSSDKLKKQILKKYQIRLDTPWLDPNKTLSEQEVTAEDELILMFRFYYHKHFDSNSKNVELLYTQARAMYISGELLTSLEDMVQFTAILYQIAIGNGTKHPTCTVEELTRIKHLIAPPICKIKSIAKQVAAYHSSLGNLPVHNAKCLFVKKWSSLELFGTEFLSFYNMDTKDKGLIGVSKNKIVLLYVKNKRNMEWNFQSLVQWKHDSERHSVALLFRNEDGTSHTLNLQLPEYSAVLVDCLEGHRELQVAVPDTCQEYQFDESVESTISEHNAAPRHTAGPAGILNGLTYEEVFWARKIDNPLFSEEERASLRGSSWENPAFENMDQLMEERFNFLDFDENAPEDQTPPDDEADSPSLTHSSYKGPIENGRQSPLVNNVQGNISSENSPRQLPRKKSEGFFAARNPCSQSTILNYNQIHFKMCSGRGYV
ncbi:hypothetical protein EMCRGX_G024024 [Ephydatia muelleri]